MSTFTFYTTSLKENDFAKPTLENGTTASGVILTPLDVVNPILVVNVANIHTKNFVYVEDLGRYYFIEDYEYTSEYNECKIKCKSAVLYNNYDNIKNKKLVFDVTGSGNYNTDLVDFDVPLLAYKEVDQKMFKDNIPKQDCFILTVLGGE